jgi:hypothetical protein
MDNREIIEKLEKLKEQVDGAIFASKTHLPPRLYKYPVTTFADTPNTFEVGDFVVTDRFWVKSQKST